MNSKALSSEDGSASLDEERRAHQQAVDSARGVGDKERLVVAILGYARFELERGDPFVAVAESEMAARISRQASARARCDALALYALSRARIDDDRRRT